MSMNDEPITEDVRDPRNIVAATLRELAQWSPQCLTAAELETVAHEAERDDGYLSCPVCQEQPCDESCPLEPFRTEYEVTPGP